MQIIRLDGWKPILLHINNLLECEKQQWDAREVEIKNILRWEDDGGQGIVVLRELRTPKWKLN